MLASLPIRGASHQASTTRSTLPLFSSAKSTHLKPFTSSGLLHSSNTCNRHPKGRTLPYNSAAAVERTTETDDVDTVVAANLDQPTTSTEPIQWTKHWYPVAVIDYLDPKKPNPVVLLGISLVVWNDGFDWRVFEDRCPHRAVPLSEGKIWEDGTLQCSYHGWRFEGEGGNCVRVPQASSEEHEKNIVSRPRACAIKYPSKIAQGFLWVWPEAGPEAEAQSESSPVPICQYLDEALKKSGDADTQVTYVMPPTFRDLPYDYSTLVDNIVDPAHVPHAHHGVQGRREKVEFGMYQMKLKKQEGRPNDISVSQTAGFGMTDLTFSPPCKLNYSGKNADGVYTSFAIWCVPTQPGKSRLLSMITTNRKLPFFVKLILKMPRWMDHTQTRHKVLDGDSVFLHMQEHLMQNELKNGTGNTWKKLFYMPTKADTLVAAFRKWLEGPGQHGPFGELYKRSDYGPLITDQRVLLNRYEQHTKNCTVCLKALKKINALMMVAAALSAVSWGALLVSAVNWVQSRSVAAATNALSTQSAAGMALAGTFFVFCWKVLDNFKQAFYYVPYVHNEK